MRKSLEGKPLILKKDVAHLPSEDDIKNVKLKRSPPPMGKARRKRMTAKIVAQNVDLYDRQRKAVAMRAAGATYDQIADALGYADKGAAHRDIHKAIYDHRDLCRQTTEEYIALEELKLERAEARLNALYQRAEKLSVADQVKVSAEIRKICESRRKLLGLDAAQQVEIAGKGGGPLAFQGVTEIVAKGFAEDAPKTIEQTLLEAGLGAAHANGASNGASVTGNGEPPPGNGGSH